MIIAALALGWSLVTITRFLLLPLVAVLLTLVGWRPAPSPLVAVATEAPSCRLAAPVAPPAPPMEARRAPLATLTVRELRTLARKEGLTRLAQRGRRADLLAALA